MDSDLKKRLLWTHLPAVIFSGLISGYFFYQVVVFTLSGHFIYHTRTNLGHPVDLSFFETPVVFMGLITIQLAFATFFAGWAVESTYHVCRILKPSLNWPLRPKFKPFRPGIILLVIGVSLIALGVPLLFLNI